MQQFEGLTEAVAEEALLGFHLCFGTFGGWPRFAPDDLGRTVKLANAIEGASSRAIDWIHIPALDTTDEAFYAPLADLAVGDTHVFLGMIHSMESFEARYRIARKFVSDFGLGAYCGLGRLEPDQVEGIFSDHLLAVEIARRVQAENAAALTRFAEIPRHGTNFESVLAYCRKHRRSAPICFSVPQSRASGGTRRWN